MNVYGHKLRTSKIPVTATKLRVSNNYRCWYSTPFSPHVNGIADTEGEILMTIRHIWYCWVYSHDTETRIKEGRNKEINGEVMKYRNNAVIIITITNYAFLRFLGMKIQEHLVIRFLLSFVFIPEEW